MLYTTEQIRGADFGAAKRMVRANLLNDNGWLVRGLMALFNRQTEDEQRAEMTKHLNRRGFNSADSEKMTSFAKQWLARNWLSDPQLGVLRRTLLKYGGQLAKIARGEGRPVVRVEAVAPVPSYGARMLTSGYRPYS